MGRIIGTVLIALSCSGAVLADEAAEAFEPPPAIDPNAPVETTTITVYKSKFFPGFRPCTEQDYRNHDYDPIACQDDEAARLLSTRSGDRQPQSLLVGDEAMPQGNLYNLRFQIFTREKRD